MDRQQILAALRNLAAALHAKGLSGDMFIVGGAAMAVAYDARRATRDIDAVFVPKREIYDTAVVVGRALGLPDDWLNDAVKDEDDIRWLCAHLGIKTVPEALAVLTDLYAEARVLPRTQFLLEELLGGQQG